MLPGLLAVNDRLAMSMPIQVMTILLGYRLISGQEAVPGLHIEALGPWILSGIDRGASLREEVRDLAAEHSVSSQSSLAGEPCPAQGSSLTQQ